MPLIVAPPLTAAFGVLGVGFYLAALGLLSVLCVLALPETKDEVHGAGRGPGVRAATCAPG